MKTKSKPKTTYYRVLDNQIGRYMYTAYNATSKRQVWLDLVSYISIDTENANRYSLESILDFWEFELEDSTEKFEDYD